MQSFRQKRSPHEGFLIHDLTSLGTTMERFSLNDRFNGNLAEPLSMSIERYRLEAFMNRGNLAIVLVILLSGCTTITMHTPTGQAVEMSPNEFTHYVEQVNSLHAKVSGALIRSMGNWSEDELDEPLQLMAAARKMVRVCEPFQQIVSESLLAEVTGKSPNLDNINSAPACEEASREVQALMP